MSGSLTVLTRRKREIEKLIKDLQKELSEIEKVLKPIEDMAAKLTQKLEPTSNEGGGGGPKRVRVRLGAKPAQVVEATKRILSEAANPMTRGELLARLKEKNIHIVGANPANTLGTTLSRHKETFRNIEGLGYWLASRPHPFAQRREDDEIENGVGAVH